MDGQIKPFQVSNLYLPKLGHNKAGDQSGSAVSSEPTEPDFRRQTVRSIVDSMEAYKVRSHSSMSLIFHRVVPPLILKALGKSPSFFQR